jgi:rhamnulose-1-phosphate aldolase/alcohol dehydrogenase
VPQTAPKTTADRWDAERADSLSPLEGLAYRSNLLGADRAVANYGGGNTSIKVTEPDHLGRPTRVLWVKGSGSDLATITADRFTALRLDEIDPLRGREEMPDAEMVAYLARCQVEPNMPRSSIETLLHAFIDAAHVDHTHPDAINAIAGAADGERLAAECFGDEALWIPYIRPGFLLSRQVGDAVAANPAARFVILAKHGLVTWGETGEESYHATLEAINRAAEFLAAKASEPAPAGKPLPAEARCELLRAVLPTLRGAVATDGAAKVLIADIEDDVAAFTAAPEAATVSQVGAACPDHLVHTKRRPLWIAYDPASDDHEAVRERIRAGVEEFREGEREYFERHRGGDESIADTAPRVVAIEGVGIVGVGRNVKAASLSRDLYHRAIAVMRGATALGGFVSLDDAESFGVEYWPLELYKLSLAPPPRELEGRVALISGGAGGIGAAIAGRLAADGACVVIADLDADGAARTAAGLGEIAASVAVDVTDEDAVAAAFEGAVLAFGGVDLIVASAGIASSAPLAEATVAEWERNYGVLARGYFLLAREGAAVQRAQGQGGAIVFIGSKNALAAGRNAVAYSSAKAAELHMARCLAEELGPDGIRVNTVNPDAVLEGSRIWDSSWREERARAYGIDPDQLEEHYRARTTLKVNITPADIAEAVAFLASPTRAAKSTGNVINVDGGVPTAYPR